MTQVSVTELRRHFGAWLDRAEAGEEIVITRRGKEVARLVPPRRVAVIPSQQGSKQFPDLTEVRKVIKLRGEPLSETIIRQRRNPQY